MTMLNWDLSDDEKATGAEETPKHASVKRKRDKSEQQPVKRKKEASTQPPAKRKKVSSTKPLALAKNTWEQESVKKKLVKTNQAPVKKKEKTTQPTEESSLKAKVESKSKFVVSSSGEVAIPDTAAHTTTADGAKEPTVEDNQSEPTKKSRKTISEAKRKSVKYKERKRKKKMAALRSTMPREKFDELMESQSKQSSVSAKDEAVRYIRLWKSARREWKFSKVRQTWLLQNMYNNSQVDDADFKTLLEYIQPLKGSALQSTTAKATELMNSYSGCTDTNGRQVLARATQVLQILD